MEYVPELRKYIYVSLRFTFTKLAIKSRIFLTVTMSFPSEITQSLHFYSKGVKCVPLRVIFLEELSTVISWMNKQNTRTGGEERYIIYGVTLSPTHS